MILMKCSLKDNDSYTCLFERNKIYQKVILLKRSYPYHTSQDINATKHLLGHEQQQRYRYLIGFVIISTTADKFKQRPSLA